METTVAIGHMPSPSSKSVESAIPELKSETEASCEPALEATVLIADEDSDAEDAQQQDEELVALASIFPDSLRILTPSHPLPPPPPSSTGAQPGSRSASPVPKQTHARIRRHGRLDVQVDPPMSVPTGGPEAQGFRIRLGSSDDLPISILVHSLPPITLHFALPSNYPSSARPRLKLTSDWAPPSLLASLSTAANASADACLTFGSVALFDIHTEITHALESHLAPLPELSVASQEALDAIHRHDQARKLAALERTPYTCLICLDPRPGRDAVMIPGCGHRFCKQCLVDFFTVLINEGMPKQVRCPHPDCPRGDEPTHSLATNSAAPESTSPPSDDPRTKLVDPVQSAQARLATHPIQPSFLTSLLGPELSTKFTNQFLARTYASDPAMHWCPRPTCGGPARGHLSGPYAKLATCLRCQFAFCVYCSRAWHGPAQACRVANANAVVLAYLEAMALPSEREREAKLLPLYVQFGRSVVERLAREHEQERETREWIKANVTPCPACGQGVSRSAGCAHMTCSACGAHFCFNCGSSLAHLVNPYKHYSTQGLPCYNRLFEGVETEDVGAGGMVGNEVVVWDEEAGQAVVLF